MILRHLGGWFGGIIVVQFMLLRTVLAFPLTSRVAFHSGRHLSSTTSSSITSIFGRHRATAIRTKMTTTTNDDDSSKRVHEHLYGQLQISLDTALAVYPHAPEQVRFVDGTWWLPTPDRKTTARQDFERGPRIPGAVYLDIDDLSTPVLDGKQRPLPHMMPSTTVWEAYMNAVHIHNSHHVILYGQATNCPFLHRSFVQILSMGHDPNKLHLLTASLEEWQAAGGPVDSEPAQVARVQDILQQQQSSDENSYKATPPQAVVSMEQVKALIDARDPNYQIVDVRAPERFYAQVDEPRPGLRLGHMPTAKNLFFKELLQPNAPIRLKSRDELETILQSIVPITDQNKIKIVASCGSGATACTLKVALMACGYDPHDILLYDGSWCEWGSYPDTPIVTTDE